MRKTAILLALLVGLAGCKQDVSPEKPLPEPTATEPMGPPATETASPAMPGETNATGAETPVTGETATPVPSGKTGATETMTPSP